MLTLAHVYTFAHVMFGSHWSHHMHCSFNTTVAHRLGAWETLSHCYTLFVTPRWRRWCRCHMAQAGVIECCRFKKGVHFQCKSQRFHGSEDEPTERIAKWLLTCQNPTHGSQQYGGTCGLYASVWGDTMIKMMTWNVFDAFDSSGWIGYNILFCCQNSCMWRRVLGSFSS